MFESFRFEYLRCSTSVTRLVSCVKRNAHKLKLNAVTNSYFISIQYYIIANKSWNYCILHLKFVIHQNKNKLTFRSGNCFTCSLFIVKLQEEQFFPIARLLKGLIIDARMTLTLFNLNFQSFTSHHLLN